MTSAPILSFEELVCDCSIVFNDSLCFMFQF